MAETIKEGKFVRLAYDVFEKTEKGEEVMFRFTEERPDKFVFGMDPGMIAGFKDGIYGLKEGEEFDICLSPDEAFGPSMPELVVEFDKEMFCDKDGVFDDERVALGNTIEMMTAEGERVPGQVVNITDEKVTLDFNHPLAGQTIHFKGSVLEVREATPADSAPRGCGGGCEGCGSGNNGGCGGCGGGCH